MTLTGPVSWNVAKKCPISLSSRENERRGRRDGEYRRLFCGGFAERRPDE